MRSPAAWLLVLSPGRSEGATPSVRQRYGAADRPVARPSDAGGGTTRGAASLCRRQSAVRGSLMATSVGVSAWRLRRRRWPSGSEGRNAAGRPARSVPSPSRIDRPTSRTPVPMAVRANARLDLPEVRCDDRHQALLPRARSTTCSAVRVCPAAYSASKAAVPMAERRRWQSRSRNRPSTGWTVSPSSVRA